MSRAGKFVVAASAVWLIANTVVAGRRTTIGVLMYMFVSFCFLAVVVSAIVLVFTEWRQQRWLAMTPLAACILAIVTCVPVGRLAGRAVFDWSLPSYERVIQQIESGTIPVSTEYAEIREAEREARLAYGVFAWKDANGVLTVIFFTESGFPALHSGYMYRSSGEPGLALEGLAIREKVRDKWFYVSN